MSTALAIIPTTFKTFAASILPFVVTIGTALTVIPETAFADPTTWVQFAGLVIAAAVSLLLPLAPDHWRGIFKTGGSVAVAILASVVTYILNDGFSVANLVLVVIAAANALAAELGVQIRTYEPKHAKADGSYDVTTLPPLPEGVAAPVGYVPGSPYPGRLANE